MKKDYYDVIIAGAGAAGMIAAGRAARMGARVLLIEKMKQPGSKLLITGKGRCNITHDAPLSVYYKNIFPNGRFLKHAFNAFFTDDIIRILNDRGVKTTTERGKRVFPVNNNALGVQKAIMEWMKEKGPAVVYHNRVSGLLFSNGSVNGVRTGENGHSKDYYGRSIIICTGGRSYPATGSTGDGYELARQAGHTVGEIHPALVPLVTKGDVARRLKGLALKNVNAVLWVNGKKSAGEFGELLFMEYGLAGPVILTLSRNAVKELAAGNRVEISIDLKPALNEKKLDARLIRDLDTYGRNKVGEIFRKWLPRQLIDVFIDLAGLDGQKLCNQINAEERKRTLLLMKDFKFEVKGTRGFREAVITSGGVPTTQIRSKTMESKLVNNLYFAGEVIDLDGNTGGFNLQIAFSTGWLAAQECLKAMKRE